MLYTPTAMGSNAAALVGKVGGGMGQQSSSTHDASLKSEMSPVVCMHAVRFGLVPVVRALSSFTAGLSQLASTNELGS